MTRPTAPDVDAIEFEVIRHALVAIADEMCVVLARSAYSTNIKTRLDLSCAVLDRDGHVIGQSTAQPNHLSAINTIVPPAIASYGVENLHPGDQIVVNDPYQGAGHLNDCVLFAPVFVDDAIVAYVANLAHHVDIGGASAGSLGAFREIYQEGIVFPVVKLVEGGRLVPDLFKLILANIRAKRETAGDFRAQVAANNIGSRRVLDLFARYGAATVDTFVAELLRYTEERSREELGRLPDGIYEAEGFMDDDGLTDEPIRLRARVTIEDGRVAFDLSGSDRQRPSPMNSTFAQSHAACVYVLRCLMDPDIPTNEGFYRLVDVYAEPGSVLNVQSPAGVAGGWEVSLRLCDVLFRALAEAVPERVPAGCKAMVCHACFGGVDPRTGEYYVFLETIAGGHGGRLGKDGSDAIQTHHQNTQNAPVEELEVGYPVLTTRYGLIPDSDGAGQFRGGLGVLREYAFLGHDAEFTILADRRKFAPLGLFGGHDAPPARYTLVSPEGVERDLPSKTTFTVAPGWTVRYETCGGGGYGRPERRDPDAVAADVRAGRISRARAREVYAVALGAGGSPDAEGTRRLRLVRGVA
jgi:N-methylhydantoinase B